LATLYTYPEIKWSARVEVKALGTAIETSGRVASIHRVA
jgi:hypothetical protein